MKGHTNINNMVCKKLQTIIMCSMLLLFFKNAYASSQSNAECMAELEKIHQEGVQMIKDVGGNLKRELSRGDLQFNQIIPNRFLKDLSNCQSNLSKVKQMLETLKGDIEALRSVVGHIPHWKNLGDYLTYIHSVGKQPKLVVGCGHTAYLKVLNLVKVNVHGPDRDTKNLNFSHSESFTINKEGYSYINLEPDIDALFPYDGILPNTFMEVFLENVNGQPHALYKDAYNVLKSGGLLVDDRYGYEKAKTESILKEIGFTEIEFNDHYDNPRNERSDQKVVFARKP